MYYALSFVGLDPSPALRLGLETSPFAFFGLEAPSDSPFLFKVSGTAIASPIVSSSFSLGSALSTSIKVFPYPQETEFTNIPSSV